MSIFIFLKNAGRRDFALVLRQRKTSGRSDAAIRLAFKVSRCQDSRGRPGGRVSEISDPWEAAMSEPYDFTRVHHVQLAIPPGGEDASRAFWVGALGMTELEKPPVLAARGGCWFGGGGVQLHLGVEADFSPARKAHPGLLVAGLRGLAARLEANGIAVTWDGEFPGHDRFYAHDPFGNRLEFLEPRSPAEAA
jgi:catechol 2,3-dioxygenase-like lactoylglutathione lyase family enzyme